MSAVDASQAEKKPRNNRRRRPASGEGASERRRNPKVNTEEGEDKAEQTTERAPRKERPASIAVPAELIGKKVNGLVTAVIKKGKSKFGFIHLGNGEKPESEVPRIYFNFTQLTDQSLVIRRGYQVEFVPTEDEEKRTFAANVQLTEEGKVTAAARETSIAEKRQVRAAEETTAKPAADAAPKQKKTRTRPRKQRKDPEPRLALLKVSLHGSSESKNIELDVNQPIGKLKSIVTTEFNASTDLSIYHITSENPTGVFLTRSILKSLNAGDHIHFSEPREDEAKK